MTAMRSTGMPALMYCSASVSERSRVTKASSPTGFRRTRCCRASCPRRRRRSRRPSGRSGPPVDRRRPDDPGCLVGRRAGAVIVEDHRGGGRRAPRLAAAVPLRVVPDVCLLRVCRDVQYDAFRAAERADRDLLLRSGSLVATAPTERTDWACRSSRRAGRAETFNCQRS